MTQSLLTTMRRVTGHLGTPAQVALLLALGLLVTGCPPLDGGGGGTDGQPTGSINNLASNIHISGEQSVTIVYNAGPDGADVRGFYVEIDSTAPDASTVGAEVVFAENLATGDNQTTALATAPLPVGIYRVGLDIAAGGQTLRVFSVGTIQITTLPDPEFTLPNQSLFAKPGGSIDVSATVGDPENAVQWRLFYIARGDRPNAAADEYGTQIAAGAANVAQAPWFTAGVPLGEYEIGIFVTDSGQTIADTVASGNTDEIKGPFFNAFIVTLSEDPPATRPPSVVVTQPSSNQDILVTDPTDPDDGNVLVTFEVTVFQGPPALQFVDVFYDFDGVADSGDERIISASLPPSATNAVFRVASIEVGTTAFLGVTAWDGVTAPVTRYASGTVRRASFDDTVFNVTSPAKGTITELTPGDSLLVRWQLNAPEATGGETTVYFRRLDQQGEPLNSQLIEADIVTNGLPLNQESYSFAMDSSGRFQATVKVDITGDPDPLIDSSGVVVVTTLPEIFWLGDLAQGNSSRRGTIFGGVNFEDNAGSSFAGGEDFNNDGRDDFIIVSRYAKPDSLNPTGVGIGEAYLIRGSSDLAGKSFNLNTVSSPDLPGLAFKGVPILGSTFNDETYGIASVFISSDADDDGLGEIWFGIPFANFDVQPSRGTTRPIERPGQFVHGGVVCVSSRTGRVIGIDDDEDGEGAPTDEIGALIRLDEVGMRFRSDRIGPEPVDGVEAIGCGSWLEDRWGYYDGECETGGAQNLEPFVGCVLNNSFLGADADAGGPDTQIEPRRGFSPVLARNFLESTGSCVGETACPSCFPAPSGTCNIACTPWVEVDVFGYPINGTFLSHPATQPLDPTLPSSQYCSGDGQTNGSITLSLGGGLYPDGTVTLPTPGDTSCDALKNQYANQIQNAFRSTGFGIVNLDQNLVVGYLDNQAFGIAGPDAFTGFYVDEIGDLEASANNPNESLTPFGMRIIGRPPTSGALGVGNHEEFSQFGTSITQVDDLMIISAPERDAFQDFDGVDFLPGVLEIEDAGVLYGFDNYAYWEDGNNSARQTLGTTGQVPPKPHMYLAGGQGNNQWDVGRWNLAFAKDSEIINEPPKIVGGQSENIETVKAVGDFNGDSRNDFAVGSPRRASSDGAVYVVFRRAPSLEGDSILDKLALATNAAERLSGILVTGDPGGGEEFGRSLAGGVDLNGDLIPDVVVGVPLANGGIGEVVVIFSQTGIVTPAGGTTIEDLLAQGRAARINGSALNAGSDFGFTLANAGDIDGDGKNDLLIAAPRATPRFDPDPSDAIDQLTEFGLDSDRDGEQDDVTGLFGRPDGVVTLDDNLKHAGLVYVIYGSTDADFWNSGTGIREIDIDRLGSPELPGYIIVGRNGERSSFAGSSIDGDYLGGGNAADPTQGGTTDKAPVSGVGGDRGRGLGLAAAGDVDGDGFDDFLLGAQLADPRVSPSTGEGIRNGGEAYLLFGKP